MTDLVAVLRREAGRWRDRGRHRPDPPPALPEEIRQRQLWVLIELGDRLAGPEVLTVEAMAAEPPADFEEPRLQCWRVFINGGYGSRWRPGPPWEQQEEERAQ